MTLTELTFNVTERDSWYYDVHYPDFVGKTIASFVSDRRHSIDPPDDPEHAYDILVTFTDGTRLRIYERMQAGQIMLELNPED